LFTGIIEEIGTIKAVIKSTKSAKLIIQASKVLEGTKIGDSISTNGVCLTVTDIYDNSFAVDVMAETIRKSSLSMLSQGDKVNLERALQVGARLGGHIVSGHIDGTGTIRNIQQEDNAIWITVAADPMILRYIIPKGSITIDGISLTVAYVDDSIFKVSIIPHTKEVTTLLYKKVGDIVNLECDLVGKYIEKLMRPKEKQEEHSNIDFEFLSRNGFI
jgi:riboflavin synthase